MKDTDIHIDDRLLSMEETPQESSEELRLRPENFSEYIGQEKVVKNIELMIESANKRSQAMDHALLSGPPGLGKTSLAMLVAKNLGSQLHIISGPSLEKKGDLAAILTNLAPRDVLFIDEVHRMHIGIEEILYSAMEDFRLDIVIGQGASARTMQIKLPVFTLIGATTRSGLLSNPLRDRFMAHLNFDYYSPSALAQIVQNNSKKMGLSFSPDGLIEIARRARGTPRIANRILRRVRDFATVHDIKQVSMDHVAESLELLEIDQLGLDAMDRKIMLILRDYYQGGPVGIDALCATLGEDKGTIEDVYEPYLLKIGMLLRTPRGRSLSALALDHLKVL